MISGILLAAGRSRRMGQTKQLVVWNSQPLVAAAFDAIAPICDEMIVVLGHKSDEVAAALEPRAFLRVSSDPAAQMFQSMKVGLRVALDANPASHCLLQLGDHPQVKPETLQRLLTESKESPGLAILPTYQTQGGHPVLIPASVARQILDAESDGGLRAFWKTFPNTCLHIEVEDSGIVVDLDTPEDLANQDTSHS